MLENLTAPETTARDRKAAILSTLREDILTLRRRPGESLDETRLSEEFGVSRTPLREVLRDLAAQGYAAVQANRGARVSDMTHQTLRDFFLTAPMIYAAILRLAATEAEDAALAELHAAQDAFRSALETGGAAERTLANHRFHRVTGEMARNPYLTPSFERLLIDHARIGMTFYRPRGGAAPENLEEASRQHDDIIAAIAAGDAERAGHLAIEHWTLSRDQIESFVMPAALDERLGFPGQAGPRI